MHGPSFFSFRFSFSIFFPKLTIFTILRLYMACKIWKITALTWQVSSLETVRKILYIIGLESMKLQTKKKIFATNPEKRTQKQAQKDMNEMEWHKMDY